VLLARRGTEPGSRGFCKARLADWRAVLYVAQVASIRSADDMALLCAQGLDTFTFSPAGAAAHRTQCALQTHMRMHEKRTIVLVARLLLVLYIAPRLRRQAGRVPRMHLSISLARVGPPRGGVVSSRSPRTVAAEMFADELTIEAAAAFEEAAARNS
jgi:hypothetical protein